MNFEDPKQKKLQLKQVKVTSDQILDELAQDNQRLSKLVEVYKIQIKDLQQIYQQKVEEVGRTAPKRGLWSVSETEQFYQQLIIFGKQKPIEISKQLKTKSNSDVQNYILTMWRRMEGAYAVDNVCEKGLELLQNYFKEQFLQNLLKIVAPLKLLNQEQMIALAFASVYKFRTDQQSIIEIENDVIFVDKCKFKQFINNLQTVKQASQVCGVTNKVEICLQFLFEKFSQKQMDELGVVIFAE